MNPMDSLMSQSIESAFDTTIRPIPVGEYMAQVVVSDDNPSQVDGVVKKEGVNQGKPWVRWDIKLEIVDPALKEALGRDKIFITHKIMIDLENGRVASGTEKNVRLGKFLAACGCNEPGLNIKSTLGKTLRIKVAQEADKTDPTIIYSSVKDVGPSY